MKAVQKSIAALYKKIPDAELATLDTEKSKDEITIQIEQAVATVTGLVSKCEGIKRAGWAAHKASAELYATTHADLFALLRNTSDILQHAAENKKGAKKHDQNVTATLVRKDSFLYFSIVGVEHTGPAWR